MASRALLLLLCSSLVSSLVSAVDFEELRVTQQLALDFEIDGESAGTVTLGLFGETAPRTVANYAALCLDAEKGYSGSRFHRIIANFMIQGGGIGRSRCERRRCVVGRAASSPTPSQHIRRKL